MTNHKWKDTSFSKHNKSEECTKCRVWRVWQDGADQYWEYHKLIAFIAQNKTHQSKVESSFERFDCEPLTNQK